jgi:hypothetical protein
LRDVALAKLDICKTECSNSLPPVGDVALSQIDAQKAGVGKSRGQRDDIPP